MIFITVCSSKISIKNTYFMKSFAIWTPVRSVCIWFFFHPSHRYLFAHAYLSEVGSHAAAHLPYDHLSRLVLKRPLPCVQLVPDRPGRQSIFMTHSYIHLSEEFKFKESSHDTPSISPELDLTWLRSVQKDSLNSQTGALDF